MEQEQKQLSLGESRVRTNFNPSSDSLVDQIKQKSAELINLVDTLKSKKEVNDTEVIMTPASNEQLRCISLAQTTYEQAAMWAVKAATF